MNCEVRGKIRFLLLAACAISLAGVCPAQYQGPAVVSPPRVAERTGRVTECRLRRCAD